MRVVDQPVRKVDAMALITGKPVYTSDIAPRDCLVVKLLRSPHAHALITSIDVESAQNTPGIACVLTYQDAPGKRFSNAGQSYPEPSPYDRLILDRRLRFVGDAVAIVAGENEKAVDKALKKIRVQYQVLEPVLDLREAKDNPVLVHPEEDWEVKVQLGGDNTRNLCSSHGEEKGDVDGVLAGCKYVVEQIYHTQACQQAMMETFRTFTRLDPYGRLEVVSSTQIPFHVRRILAHALELPKHKIRVIKPRIGGGFGAKQTAVCEVYPALVTMKTGRPAQIIYSREESQIASSPRHEMEIRVRVGADENGIVRAVDMYTLSNTGAYGEHGPTTVGLSGHKSIPIYAKAEAYRFHYDVVYTNQVAAGAYRGYGATQGFFALESAIDELAAQIGIDPLKLREKNIIRQGDAMPAYYGETALSCTLDQCLARAKEMIGWDEKYPRRVMPDGKIRSVGGAVCMQGSGIAGVDVGSVNIKINDDGFYTLMIGATDMGTGCDTILAQMAAECLGCEVDDIIVQGVDTDVSPYDTGSYASSTTYITGMAVVKACEILRERILELGAKLLECSEDVCEFDGRAVRSLESGRDMPIGDIANHSQKSNDITLTASATHFSPTSPPPYMAGVAEIEIDPDTGKITLLDYAAVVDCGTVINPNLARIQAEGGLVQGIGMALYEDVVYDTKGRMVTDSFLQYKIPTRLDIKSVRVEFCPSYEPSGPFGAKSIGEVVINTPSPAIANAVYNGVGVRIRELPLTPEKVFMAMKENS